MVFNSWTFIIFFLVVLALHNLPLNWTTKKINLLLASYLFYAAWNPPFVALLWLTTVVDWVVAKRMAKTTNPGQRRGLLLISLFGNLGLLAFFKYGTFLLENFVWMMSSVGMNFYPAAPSIILPIGISFYTFVTLSYTIDVYRGATPAKSFLDFALLVTFFPHLVAGPILRAESFLPQCQEPRRANSQQLGWGMVLIVVGLFEKIVLADGLMAPVADQVYNATSKAGGIDAWIGTLAFSGQIFFDFDGYSLCAIGAALCLGFVFPDNFRFPYAAIGFSDFWQRWHVSLSSWLRDYLYISLGGNRQSRWRTYINLMLTMLIGGLWHGASWRFVIWGGLHGSYLAVERFLRDLAEKWVRESPSIRPLDNRGASQPPGYIYSSAKEEAGQASMELMASIGRFGLAVLTYLLVCLTWVFFRAQDFKDAFQILRKMFAGGVSQLELGYFAVSSVLIVTLALLIVHWLLRDSSLEQLAVRTPVWARAMIIALLLWAIATAPGDDRAFIYFQF